jgi:hypothetical protein
MLKQMSKHASKIRNAEIARIRNGGWRKDLEQLDDNKDDDDFFEVSNDRHRPPRRKNEYTRPRIYCGNKDTLPNKYQYFGSPYTCLQTGIAVGRKLAGEEITHRLENLAIQYDVSIIDENGRVKPHWDLIEDLEKAVYN